MMQNKEIKSGVGLGNIKFGMTREELEKLIGEPDDIEDLLLGDGPEDDLTDEEEESESELWHYDDLEMSVSFDEVVDWRLVNIAVSSSDYTFNGVPIIGLDRAALLDVLKKAGVTDLEVEDCSAPDSPNQMQISSESLGINFWLENDVLAEVQWGPLFEDEDTVKWPA